MRNTMVVTVLLIIGNSAFAQVNSIESVLAKHEAAAAATKTGEPKTTLADTSDCARVKAALENSGEKADAKKSPLSYFGAGIGAIRNISDEDWIADAALVEKKVVIIDDDNVIAGPVLEAHALVFTRKKLWALPSSTGGLFVTDTPPPCTAKQEFPLIAHGPFVMLRVGDKEIIKSAGLGWMMGFRIQQTNNSLNIGIGYAYELNVKNLAKGFEEGTDHADNATIRYRTTHGDAITVVVSFGF